jgi:Zn finger protein HypA/HybF involved in hydrogenase expression
VDRPHFEVVVRVVKGDKVLVERVQTIGAQFKPEAAFRVPDGTKTWSEVDMMLAMSEEIVTEMKSAPFGMMTVECINNLRQQLGSVVTSPVHYECEQCSEIFAADFQEFVPTCPKCQSGQTKLFVPNET